MSKINTPNKLLIIRGILALGIIVGLLLIPFFPQFTTSNGYSFINSLNYIVLALFVVAISTDFLDGYLARKNDQITNLGKLFDPIIDKVLVNSIMIIMSIYTRIPVWFVILFIIRDLFVEGLRVMLSINGEVLSANLYGKLKTLWQYLGILILFIWFPTSASLPFYWNQLYSIALIPLSIALLFSLISGVIYYKDNIKKIDLFN